MLRPSPKWKRDHYPKVKERCKRDGWFSQCMNNHGSDGLYKKFLTGGWSQRPAVTVPEELRQIMRRRFDHADYIDGEGNTYGYTLNARDVEQNGYKSHSRELRMIEGISERVIIDTIDKLMSDMDMNEYFSIYIDPPGLPGWSDESEFCVECGTFFHDHYKDNLCWVCHVFVGTGITRETLVLEGKDAKAEALHYLSVGDKSEGNWSSDCDQVV